ncbi:MAG: YciI family protein [Limnothrix sp.]
MSKLFVVVVATVPEYYEYKKEHPEHDQNQVAWFKEQAAKGVLLSCGPFYPHDGTGIWILQAADLAEAEAIAATSPRATDGLLAPETRIVEWQSHIGRDRFFES